nr:golgin subfamily B member 1 isoform X4 [Crassostrea gigas]
MSDLNPPDDEDSGYTSKNQTESLPTTGSVPDIAAAESSSSSSENIKSISTDQKDSKSVKMQKDSRQGDLDETVVAGSLPASPSTPPSSRAELSPLVTSTPKQSREFSKESNTRSTERKDNEQAQGLIGSSISQSTESDKRDATKLEGSATSTGGSGIQSIKNLLSLGARPKSPKVSRWAALKKQETSQSSRSSLWQHVVNSSIINIHDIGSGVDGAPARKAEPKPKPLWKFNRPADVGSSNEVEAAENESEAANAERKGESRESISEPSSPEIPPKKEQAMEMSDMEKLSEVLTKKGDVKDIVSERPSTQLPSEKELVRKASDKEKSLEEVSKELGNANETPEIFKEAIDRIISTEYTTEKEQAGEALDKENSLTDALKKKENAMEISDVHVERSLSEISPEKDHTERQLDTEKSLAEALIEKDQSEGILDEESKIEDTSTLSRSRNDEVLPSTVPDQGMIETHTPVARPILSEDTTSVQMSNQVFKGTYSNKTSKSTDPVPYETDDYTYMNLGTPSSLVMKASLPPDTSELHGSPVQIKAGGVSDTKSIDSDESKVLEQISKETPSDEENFPKEEKRLLREDGYPRTEDERDQSIEQNIQRREETDALQKYSELEGNYVIEKNDYLKNPEFISNQETEQSKEAIFDLNQDESNEISFEVPEALKTYIDPLCTEWQDPNNRKMIYKLAVQKYYSDTGTKFESADACLLKPTKQLLKETYSRRSSLKGGAIPGDLLKTMLKEKAAVELADRRHSCNEETWKQNRPETGYLKRKTMSEDGVGLSGSGLGNKDDSLKRSHLEKETAEFSHRTPGYGAYSFHNLSRLVIPEMEEDEANIAMSVRRKSDLDISSHHNWKPPKLALEDSFKRSHKSLPSVIKNKTKHFLKKYDNENAENQKMMGEKNPPDNCDQDLSKETISSKLPEALEQWNHPQREKESTGIESSSIASSKELTVSENHGEDSDVDQQVQQTTVVKADLPERKMRSVTEIQREGYGEVDFNSPTLVLENLKINTSTEGEDNKESTDQALETKNPNNEKKGPSALLINSTMTEGSKSRCISPTAEPENEEGVDTTDAIDNSPKLATKNPDIESIKLLLQTTLDQQSALLQKQSLVSAIILQSLQKGNLKEEDLSTLVSLHEAGEINLEKSTPKNIMMIQPKEGEPNTKIQSGKKSLDGKLVNRAQGHKHKDHSLPSEVLKRKLEKVIKEKVPLDKTERTESPNSSIDKGYESGVDTSAHTENNTLDQDQLEERESRRFCFANREETEECNDTRDLIKRLNPSSVLVESISDEELEVYTPSSSSFSKSYSDRKLRGFSERSSSHLDDYDEELISFYSHEDFDLKKKVSGQSKDIYEMGSNMQLCNFHVQPSNNSLKVQETSHLSYNKYKTEYTAREINTEPGAIIYKLNNPNTVPAKDVRFKDSPLFLRNSDDYPSELSDPVSSVASFPHINSLEVTANQSYQALSDDGSQEESEELINLPPKRVTSIRDFLKLLYSRDPEFIRQSLSSADCEYTTLKQLLHAFSSLTTDGSANDVAESPRKRSLPSVSPRSMTPEARSWLMEKEVLENQTRKLQMEVSSLHTENKILKERLNRAQVTVENLEEKLSSNRDEVDSVYHTLQQQQMEAERKASDEKSEEHSHLQSQIEKLYQENYQLKSEVLKFEKHLDAAEKASSQIKLSAEKAKTLEAYKMEVLTLREEAGKVKALLEQSENHLHEEEVRSKGLNQQVIKLTEMKNLLQQQLDRGGGGTVSEKQQLRDLKSQYETKLQQTEEKLRDSQSQLATFETTYREQLNTLVKERHDSFARLKTTEDLLEALRGENEILKTGVGGSVSTKNSNAQNNNTDALHLEIKNLENQLHRLQTRNQVLEGEVHTLRVQLEGREKALEEAQSEADLANRRLDNTDTVQRKQDRIDQLLAENQNLLTEIRILREKNGYLTDEKKRSDTNVANCQREINVLKSRQKEGKAGDLADNKYVQSLQEELQQKEVQLSLSNRDLQSLESELQQTRHAMYSEQAQIANLQAQVDSLRDQLEQKNSILDTVGGSESDSQSHYNSLKDTLESLSQELALVQAQNKTLQAEVNREKSRCEILQEEMSRTSVHSEPRESSDLELRIKQLEEEQDRLQEQLIETSKSNEELTQNMIDTQSESQKLQQEISSEQAKLLHMSAQKGELEQHLEEIAEEHDALIQEKTQSEEDLVKLENKVQEMVNKFETDSQRQHNNFQTHYGDIPPEFRKMAAELDSLRTLLDAKTGEMEMLQDKLTRQSMETEFLQRRIELLHSENQCNREDIARLTGELAHKITEASSLKEVNQTLSRERVKIQHQRETDEREKALERSHNEKYRKDVSEVIHKLKEEKKFSSRTDKEEVRLTNQRLDLLSSEHEKVLNSLNAEKQATAQLQADVQKYQRECAELKEQLQTITMEFETAKAQLSARDETIDSLKQDKGAFYQEYDSMCRRLAEKDEKIEMLQQKYNKSLDTMKQEFSQQKLNLEQERTSAESDLDKAKEKINFLNEEIKQKDAQLVTFGRALHELEEASKKKHELENQVEMLEFDCSSVKQLLQNHQREIESHQSTIHRMQEIQAKLQVEKTRLTDQLKEEKETSSREIQHLKKTLSDTESHHEGEKAYLKENLSQTQARLKAVETSLASAVEARDKYQMTNRMLEHSLEEKKSKLEEESTCFRVAEKKSETLQSQLNDSRRERFLTEDKLNQCQTNLVKVEKELRAERDHCLELEERIQELEAVSATQQSAVRAKQEQVDVLQSEIGKLRQIIDGQKQQLGGKLKKSAQEFKQQLDLVEMEKEQLLKQNQQLTFDLEKARETIQSKNKEILKIQENILNLEEQIRERSSKLKKMEDNLKVEEEIQSKLASRYQEQEDEVNRMKNFLSKKAEEATDADKSMWQDMSKVIQDMSLKIQQHFEGSKERENQREQDLKLIKKYKKQVRDLEGDLNTERAVHSITKSSLQALEEDCQRLKKQFMASKRRDKSSADKSSKSRMEAINEIIARSQTQAQNMLAAGGYFEETLRSITTPRNANYNYHDGSPDTSIASDFSFNSVSPAVMATYPSQAKSPRK